MLKMLTLALVIFSASLSSAATNNKSAGSRLAAVQSKLNSSLYLKISKAIDEGKDLAKIKVSGIMEVKPGMTKKEVRILFGDTKARVGDLVPEAGVFSFQASLAAVLNAAAAEDVIVLEAEIERSLLR